LFGIQLGQYASFAMLKKRVLEVAVTEINEKTDLKVSYTVERFGRKILSVRFKMSMDKKSLSGNKYLIERLKVFGIHEKQIKKLLEKHDEDYILANLKAVEDRINEGGEVKNVSAYLMSAFEKDYRIEETEFEKTQKGKLTLAAEQEQQAQKKELELAVLKGQYLEERNAELNKVIEGLAVEEYDALKGEFEEKIMQTAFHAGIYKTKGFEFGAIQIERRKFLIEKFLPSHLHSFENYGDAIGQAVNLSN
jgi:hypothetical protein